MEKIGSQVKKLRRRIYSATINGDKKKIGRNFVLVTRPTTNRRLVIDWLEGGSKFQRLMVRSNCNFFSYIRRVRSSSSAKYTLGPDDYVFF